MGFELLIVIGTIFMLPFVAAGFVVFWAMNHRESAALEDTWESYAARRLREYVPARGDWPNRSSPSVRWRSDGIRYELSVLGREAVARTCLSAWPRERIAGDFVVATRARAGASVSPDLFDRTFAFEEERPGLVARVLDAASRRALLGFHQHGPVTLHYRRGALRLAWAGRESNDARIDEGEALLRALTRHLEHVEEGEPPVASGTVEPR